jgi:DNA-binding CsgD family transcriptional regulator
VRIADAAADADAARRLDEEVSELAARRGTPAVRGTAPLSRGVIEQDPDLPRGAAGLFRASGRVLFEGYGFENLAVVLARAGGRPRQADGPRTHWGSRPARGRAERRPHLARLRRHGVRGLPRASRSRARSGWEALTETELRVAGLVAKGFSNPEIGVRLFVSRRTVRCHVSSILTKPALKSRVELALAYSRRAAGPPGPDVSSSRPSRR